MLTESNDLTSVQDIQGKGLAGLIKPILNQGKNFFSLTYLTKLHAKFRTNVCPAEQVALFDLGLVPSL